MDRVDLRIYSVTHARAFSLDSRQNNLNTHNTMKKLTYRQIQSILSRYGIVNHETAEAFARKHPEDTQTVQMLATNTSKLRRDGTSTLKVEHRTYLFGGTGSCGNCWPAGSGSWYPTAMLVRFGKGLPKLVAVIGSSY